MKLFSLVMIMAIMLSICATAFSDSVSGTETAVQNPIEEKLNSANQVAQPDKQNRTRKNKIRQDRKERKDRQRNKEGKNRKDKKEKKNRKQNKKQKTNPNNV